MQDAESLDLPETQSMHLLVTNQSENALSQEVATLEESSKQVESSTTEMPLISATEEAAKLDSSHILSVPLPSASDETTEAQVDKMSAGNGSAQSLKSTADASLLTTSPSAAYIQCEAEELDSASSACNSRWWVTRS
jgi:hypothetical protein